MQAPAPRIAPPEPAIAASARAHAGDPRPAGHGARIPSLDGLRAVSILLVLFAHALGTENFLPFSLIRTVGDLGNLGVRVFFVISGYLITSLLFHEIAKTGRVDLKGFYIRRTFRIFPAFYFYLAVISIVAALGLIPLGASEVFYAATYTVNYVHTPSWYVGHIWSLSVEEQFYLLWPATLLLLPAVAPVAEAKRRGAVKVALAVVLLAPVARIGAWLFLPAQRALIGEAFPTIADAIAFGCLLAGVRGWLGAQPAYLGFLRSRWFILVPLAIPFINRLGIYPRIFFVAGETLLDLSIALVVDRVVRFPDGISGRILNNRALSYVGVLSYSIYLWQQPFLNRTSSALPHRFPMNFLCLAGAALLSYYLVERPMLELRVKLFDKKK